MSLVTHPVPLTSNGFELDSDPSRLGVLEPVPAAERQDRDALWRRLRRDGYLYLPQFLDPEVVLTFRRFYFEHLGEVGLLDPSAPPVEGIDSGGETDRAALRERLFESIVPSPEYQEFCTQSAIADWFAWLYEGETFLHRRKIIRHTRPGESGIGTATQAHYDLVYLREGTDRLLSLWAPLGDTPIERGPLVYLEGSHHRYIELEQSGELGRPMSLTADLPGLAEKYNSRWLMTDFKAGDVMVHSPYIVHASLDNLDPEGRLRLSTDIRYQRAADPIDWRWQHHWSDDDGL